MDRKSAIEPDAPGISNDTFDPNFEFKDVAFEYPARPDQKIFKGMFNLKGTQNQTIALVGPSGCGKVLLALYSVSYVFTIFVIEYNDWYVGKMVRCKCWSRFRRWHQHQGLSIEDWFAQTYRSCRPGASTIRYVDSRECKLGDSVKCNQ